MLRKFHEIFRHYMLHSATIVLFDGQQCRKCWYTTQKLASQQRPLCVTVTSQTLSSVVRRISLSEVTE